jgi:hypothetical protein
MGLSLFRLRPPAAGPDRLTPDRDCRLAQDHRPFLLNSGGQCHLFLRKVFRPGPGGAGSAPRHEKWLASAA